MGVNLVEHALNINKIINKGFIPFYTECQEKHVTRIKYLIKYIWSI